MSRVRYRDATPRVTLAMIRAQYPRTYRGLRSVRLAVEGCAAEVVIDVLPSKACLGGERRWFRCPVCGAPCDVLGCVPGKGWVCPRCGGWRSRNRRRQGAAGDEAGVGVQSTSAGSLMVNSPERLGIW